MEYTSNVFELCFFMESQSQINMKELLYLLLELQFKLAAPAL